MAYDATDQETKFQELFALCENVRRLCANLPPKKFPIQVERDKIRIHELAEILLESDINLQILQPLHSIGIYLCTQVGEHPDLEQLGLRLFRAGLVSVQHMQPKASAMAA